ncbi:MAG: tetratricopeptide repeat protein [Rhodobacteraceae bacterium]|nr:tetratricopeptide repeat protein [Paracoccaceae bacterium]
MLKTIRVAVLSLFLASPVVAQEMTLEDIRIDLVQLAQQIEALRGELSATGTSGLSEQEAASAMVRIDEFSEDLRAALGRVEALEIRIQAIVDDGTRRIGDLDFRLTEFEGGDTGLLGNTVPLGGQNDDGAADLALGERADFNAAKRALEDGDGATAATLLSAFVTTYPDGPLSVEARFLQGEALSLQGDHQNAARSYLKSFSSAPDSPFAAQSLYGLSVSLNALGQTEQACLTLSEIQIRYPDLGVDLARDVLEQKAIQGCS